MHKGRRVLLLIAIVASLTLRILAQDVPSEYESPSPPTLPSKDDRKYTLFKKFLDVYQNDEGTAYEVAKECLDKYPDTSEQTKYLKKWVNNFLTRARLEGERQVRHLIDTNRFYAAFKEGRQLLESEPEDITMLFNLSEAALDAFVEGDLRFSDEGVGYAKSALKLTESGKDIEKKTEKVAYLNHAIGMLLSVRHPDEAIPYLYKAIKSEQYNSDAMTYAFLADALQAAEYAPLQKKYSDQFGTVQQKLTKAGELLRQQLNLVADAIIDCQARAIALARSDSHLQEERARWLMNLRPLYKFRNSGYETGLQEFIDDVLKNPMVLKLHD